MPEAAEVEVVRRGLIPVVGQHLQQFSADRKHQAHGHEADLLGKKLLAVERHGKQLGFDFGQLILVSHLRMTGRWSLTDEPNARARLLFTNAVLTFHDPRGFATLAIKDKATWKESLGPDLLALPMAWQPVETFRSRQRSVKATLLDQQVCAGIGNYLADESLWQVGVNPAQESRLLSSWQWEQIYFAAQKLALAVLDLGGTKFRDFAAVSGQSYGSSLLQVYGRAQQPCHRCGFELAKTRVAGRGTTYCPHCQPLVASSKIDK